MGSSAGQSTPRATGSSSGSHRQARETSPAMNRRCRSPGLEARRHDCPLPGVGQDHRPAATQPQGPASGACPREEASRRLGPLRCAVPCPVRSPRQPRRHRRQTERCWRHADWCAGLRAEARFADCHAAHRRQSCDRGPYTFPLTPGGCRVKGRRVIRTIKRCEPIPPDGRGPAGPGDRAAHRPRGALDPGMDNVPSSTAAVDSGHISVHVPLTWQNSETILENGTLSMLSGAAAAASSPPSPPTGPIGDSPRPRPSIRDTLRVRRDLPRPSVGRRSAELRAA